MKIKYCGETSPLELTKGRIYDVIAIEKGWYRIVDDSGEDYLYPPQIFLRKGGFLIPKTE